MPLTPVFILMAGTHLPKVVFDLGAVIITRELCVGIFDEIDCFIVLFSNGGLPKGVFDIKI